MIGIGASAVTALIITIVLVALYCSSDEGGEEAYKLTTFNAAGDKKVMDMSPEHFFEAMRANVDFMLSDKRKLSDALLLCIADLKISLDKRATDVMNELEAANENNNATVPNPQAVNEVDVPLKQAPNTKPAPQIIEAVKKPISAPNAPATNPVSLRGVPVSGTTPDVVGRNGNVGKPYVADTPAVEADAMQSLDS